MKVSEAMTRNPHVVRPEAGLPEAGATMREHDIGSLPVVENGRIVGILTDRDLATRVVAEGRATWPYAIRGETPIGQFGRGAA